MFSNYDPERYLTSTNPHYKTQQFVAHLYCHPMTFYISACIKHFMMMLYHSHLVSRMGMTYVLTYSTRHFIWSTLRIETQTSSIKPQSSPYCCIGELYYDPPTTTLSFGLLHACLVTPSILTHSSSPNNT